MKLSVQTFTIRKQLQTNRGIEASFKKLGEMGVEAVELARIGFSKNEIQSVKEASNKHNVEIGSTQITYDFLVKNFDWVIEFHKILDCKYTCVSVLPTKYILGNEKKLLAFSHELNELGKRFLKEGIYLLYHHHHFEFRKYGNRLGFDVLSEALNQEYVGFVLDTYWLQRGGKSPQDFIEKYAGKVKVVHLRDFKLNWKPFNLLPNDTELGNGNLDFKKIKEACIRSGVLYAAIEQDTKTPFESLEQSINYYRTI
ncbi:MAG: sugar phosphate isomerase/epimerase family protein [Prolixibacteraceae bacterium]